MNDIDIGNFADNNTQHVSVVNTKSFVKSPESTTCRTFEWFKDDQTKGNGDSHVFLNIKEKVDTKVDSPQFQNCHFEKLLRVIIDNKLGFEEHIKILCGKKRSLLSALSRVTPFMKLN